MEFERDTLTQVMEARARAVSATGRSRREPQRRLSRALGRLFAVAKISGARANDNVRSQERRLDRKGQFRAAVLSRDTRFNTTQQTFPSGCSPCRAEPAGCSRLPTRRASGAHRRSMKKGSGRWGTSRDGVSRPLVGPVSRIRNSGVAQRHRCCCCGSVWASSYSSSGSTRRLGCSVLIDRVNFHRGPPTLRFQPLYLNASSARLCCAHGAIGSMTPASPGPGVWTRIAAVVALGGTQPQDSPPVDVQSPT
jgi:hypothetical protein